MPRPHSHGFFAAARSAADGSPGGNWPLGEKTVGADPMPDGPLITVAGAEFNMTVGDAATACELAAAAMLAREFESRRSRLRSAPRSAAV